MDFPDVGGPYMGVTHRSGWRELPFLPRSTVPMVLSASATLPCKAQLAGPSRIVMANLLLETGAPTAIQNPLDYHRMPILQLNLNTEVLV